MHREPWEREALGAVAGPLPLPRANMMASLLGKQGRYQQVRRQSKSVGRSARWRFRRRQGEGRGSGPIVSRIDLGRAYEVFSICAPRTRILDCPRVLK